MLRFSRAALLAIVLVSSPLGAQGVSVARGWTLQQWTIDDGLPQSTVNAIHQGRDGFLWLATNGGLARFDGIQFETFSRAEHPGLGSERLLSIAGGSGGDLWIGSEHGLIRRSAHGFTTWRAVDGLPSDLVNAVFVDSANVVWAGTQLGLVQLVGDSLRTYGTPDGLRSAAVSGVVADGQDGIWVNMFWAGSVARRGNAFDVATSDAHWARDIGDFLIRDSQGRRWHRSRSGRGMWREIDDRFLLVEPALRPPGWFVSGMVNAPDGALWYATFPRGEVWRVSPEALREGAGAERIAVLADRVQTLAFDREGNLWMGSEVRGLFRLRAQFVRTLTAADGLRGASMAALIPDRQRAEMIVGGNCGGLHRVRSGSSTTVTAVTVAAIGTPSPCVWALAHDSTGSLWIGLHGGGLHEVRADRSLRQFRMADGLPADEVFALLAARDGRLWVGTSRGLAVLHNGQLARWHAGDVAATRSIRALVEDTDGTVWVGSVSGLGRIRGDSTRWWTAADGLSHDYVRAIVRDDTGALWLGTYGGGLSRFDGTTFTTVNAARGLPDDFLSSIVPDGAGNFWMSSNHGIFRAGVADLEAVAHGRRPRLSATLYDRADGMLNAEANGGFQPSGVRHGDGTLWFATIEGVAVIDPTRVVEVAAAPQTWILRATADGVPLDVSTRLVVPPGTRQLEIHYTAPTFTAPDKTRFRYRLEGFDPDWVDVGARRVAYYTAPPAGEHRFLVGAANRGGDWTTTPTTLAVNVVPFVWQRWWFTPLLSLLVLLLAVQLVRRRFALLARERAQREAFARELLDRQESERKRIAGELHDGLSQELLVVTNRSTLALRADSVPDDARHHLELIGGAAQGALESVRSLARALRPHQIDRLGLTQAIESQLLQATEAAGLTLDLTLASMDERFDDDARIHVFRIVQEVVNNVIKHAQATTLWVEATVMGSEVMLRLRDDGRGFSPSGAEGFGMTGIAERVRLLGGTWQVTSAPGEGCEYRFVLPTLTRTAL
ncbi:MAG: hypothetical protein KF689_13835 [Gemmatimonadaceae bacterium]|nr:hypothetical protein [Gemmatimonadaceae bacterium]MCW5826934.1 hypothetical protein [Gemmatimonadaceae bacterium]